MDENRTRPVEGPQSLGDVVTRLVALRGYAQSGGQRQLERMWRHAAGEEIGRTTRVLGLKNGTLMIGVGSSALLSELAAFHKQDLLQKVRSGSEGRICDLKFRLRGDLNAAG